MAVSAEIAFPSIKSRSVGQGDRAGLTKREVPRVMGSMAGKATYFRRVAHEFFDIDFSCLHAFDKTLVGVATLTIIRIGVGRVAEGSVPRGQILTSHTAHRVFGLRTVTVNASFRENRGLRPGNPWEQQANDTDSQKTTPQLDNCHTLLLCCFSLQELSRRDYHAAVQCCQVEGSQAGNRSRGLSMRDRDRGLSPQERMQWACIARRFKVQKFSVQSP